MIIFLCVNTHVHIESEKPVRIRTDSSRTCSAGRVYMKYKQPRRSEDNEYIKLEAQLLKIVENSVIKGKGSMSVRDLVELVGSFQELDPFTLKMQVLTLEGKGLIRKTQHGYILTEKGKKRL